MSVCPVGPREHTRTGREIVLGRLFFFTCLDLEQKPSFLHWKLKLGLKNLFFVLQPFFIQNKIKKQSVEGIILFVFFKKNF